MNCDLSLTAKGWQLKVSPRVKQATICNYTFQAIKNNYSTVLRQHYRQLNIRQLSEFPGSIEVQSPADCRSGFLDTTYSIPQENGRTAFVSPTQLHSVIAILEKIDPIGATCLQLKLNGLSEAGIASNLNCSLNEARGHVRRAKGEFQTILSQQLE